MKLAIVGKSCSGKSTLAKLLGEQGLHVAVTYTTRPRRVYEVDGKDYHFLTESQFVDMDDRGNIVESKNFNGWYYGMGLGEFKQSDVFIITPSGVQEYRDLCKEFNEQLVVLYIDATASIRMDRSKRREDVDNVNRRFVADELDFVDYNDWDIKVSIKDNESVEAVINLIKSMFKNKTNKN